MKTTLASSLLVLLFATLVSAQTRTGPQLGKYGNLIGIKGSSGKYILSKIKRPWHEGYAIAYRVKNDNGVEENRVVYVIGNQRSSNKLKVQKAKSTRTKSVVVTPDKVLEITRSFTWDQQSRTLKTETTIANISCVVVSITAVESQLDARLVGDLAPGIDPLCPFPIPAPYPNVYRPISDVAEGLPSCGCEPRCKPDGGAFFRTSSLPEAFNRDPIGGVIPSFDVKILSLFWSGSILNPSKLGPKDRVVISSSLLLAR